MINEFRDEYYFLSNFYPCNFEYNGYKWTSVEAAFQAMKCPDRMAEFVDLTPSKAKYLGRRVKLRSDWGLVKLGIMYEILATKFTDPILKQKLIDTKDEELVEGTWWKDTYWGIDLKTGKGQNNLGKLLMKLRSELIK